MEDFFKKVKDKFSDMQSEYRETVLNSRIDDLVGVLQAIDNHIEYESELANNVGLKRDILDKYDPVKYIVEIDNKILRDINSSESLCWGFYRKAIFLDLSKFKHVNEKIYSELLYRMFEMSAKNKKIDVTCFIRELYLYCGKNEFAYAGESLLAQLKKYLQLAEPYIIKTKQSEDAKETRQSSESESETQSGSEAKTDFFAETKEDAYGAKLISDLLFKYSISNARDLNTMYAKIGFAHFFFCVLIPFAAAVPGFVCFSPLGIACLIVGVVSLSAFVYRLSKLEYLKKAIAKIATAAKIGEDYIYSALKDRYGKNLKKLL
ncbi:hypothetical protein HMPREF9194_01822 [Treponema maltophilum ATCC 51939]|uniref:Uncharacterized protein n=1 Tax=Treponema maltophilum ATCC 51939 TaxID=1125699 RepID=S3K3E1_TREMA|nr:hypothetical protein [Treponema maltophilum]EPF31476.1 hypothetical protein HMPREF9194_01822 [Treponema maltophilum ATCC 51939]